MKIKNYEMKNNIKNITDDKLDASSSSMLELAKLWWVYYLDKNHDEYEGSIVCQVSQERAPNEEELWNKVSHRAKQLYCGKTWAEYKKVMGSFSSSCGDRPPEEHAWAFKSVKLVYYFPPCE